ncbi:bifunctional diaminohydroxyphosphoribosylaminopyrimidine deaminase/5-amino-6-(5-phosphoribosylamino)uracil reductase RibD [Shewanella maritima]|uniref:bifunctional diaminohydroxyphosphoribosylaminopyrimidine deaminase/5-amino-6-(5-phosphoribosylamino)uracil reductase RibD n=1 Tax=Shewanella maritima TaxID=2520507 RepID=UPI003736B28A
MANWSLVDRKMMTLALQLAEKGRYTTRPNPRVGCVITKDDEVIAQGYHQRAGQGHAEANALTSLKEAGISAEGATAYVTLEPCSHYGRTPPCAEGLINAKVARVVVAVLDPNPLVAGRGVNLLRDAGITVDVGLYEAQAFTLNRGFMKRMQHNLPWVTLKVASSLDGKTALANGESKWITGPMARQDVQRLRAQSCALISGSNTVLIDNPTLNVRYSELGSVCEQLTETETHQPIRVILDTHAKLRPDLKLFQSQSHIILVSAAPYTDEVKQAFPDYVTCLDGELDELGRIKLAPVLVHLANHYQCNSVLVEAGATLCGSFVDTKLADDLVLYQAPKILGSAGRNMLNLPNYTAMTDVPSMQLVDERNIGDDKRYIIEF